MSAISGRMPEVEVEYDSLTKPVKRLRKHFVNPYKGRSFYKRMLLQERNPSVHKPQSQK